MAPTPPIKSRHSAVFYMQLQLNIKKGRFMDFEESVETAEVAEQPEEITETGVEEPEAADQVSEEPVKTSQDAAFAEMRRARESAEREAAEMKAELDRLKAEAEARTDAFNRLSGSENGEIAALAEITGMSEDDIRAEMDAARESAQKDLRISQLEREITDIKADRAMQDDLATLQKIDPSLKSLNDLPPEYGRYINAGLDAEDAYWACKAKETANRREPPKPVGKVSTGATENDYFTDAEIDAMSSEQLTKNWKKIMASWDRKK